MRGARYRLNVKRRKAIRPKLIAMQGGCCCYCGAAFDDNRWGDLYATFEHIENRAAGGANAQTNLAMACHGCNQRAAHEKWSVEFKRARIKAANIVALADLEVEPMELPPEYLARAQSRAA